MKKKYLVIISVFFLSTIIPCPTTSGRIYPYSPPFFSNEYTQFGKEQCFTSKEAYAHAHFKKTRQKKDKQ